MEVPESASPPCRDGQQEGLLNSWRKCNDKSTTGDEGRRRRWSQSVHHGPHHVPIQCDWPLGRPGGFVQMIARSGSPGGAQSSLPCGIFTPSWPLALCSALHLLSVFPLPSLPLHGSHAVCSTRSTGMLLGPDRHPRPHSQPTSPWASSGPPVSGWAGTGKTHRGCKWHIQCWG